MNRPEYRPREETMKSPNPVSVKVGLVLSAVMAAMFSMPVSTQPAGTNPDPFQVPAYKQAFFDASRIYGKAGCGDIELAQMTADNAIRAKVSASVIAAIVAVESTCNPLAISNRGAVGLTQVNVKVQSSKYAQFRTINLFNPDDSMRVGTDILADMIHQYGLHGGVSHYNGEGPDAEAYAVKVLALAGR